MKSIVKRIIDAVEARNYRVVEPGMNGGNDKPAPTEFIAKIERESKIRIDRSCGCRQYRNDDSKSWEPLDYCWQHWLSGLDTSGGAVPLPL
jgi:hypothetical protein